ncbi:hypothetical protein NQZ79_g3030 [Umbelopsis isabellina]|nr:hypothetical protein NQZ79_g3030 [Umbelopsis isabellina]
MTRAAPKYQSPEMEEAANAELIKVTQTEIPKIVHFVLLEEQTGYEWSLINHLAVKSAHEVLKPDRIILHYHKLPIGKWMDISLPYLTLNKAEIPKEVFGKPAVNKQHISDIYRFKIMQEYGGIYLDTDVISLKSIDHLLNETMLFQALDNGLCNAVMISRANSSFITRCVKVPGMIAKEYPTEIRALPQEAFFKPLYYADGLKQLYEERTYDFSSNLMVHLWHFASEHVEAGDRACYFPKQTKLHAGLVGHWPIAKVSNETDDVYERLEDISDNKLHGFSKNGTFEDKANLVFPSGMKLTKTDSFIILPMLSEAKMDNLTVSWNMTILKDDKKSGTDVLTVVTEKFKLRAKIMPNNDLGVVTDGQNNGTWKSAGIETTGIDEQEHRYTLSINANSNRITLYKDNVKRGAIKDWKPPSNSTSNKLTKLFFGGDESLPASYRDIWIWNNELDAKEAFNYMNIM